MNQPRILLVVISLSTLVAILGVAPAFGQTANEIDMTKGAGSSATADCVGANNCFTPNPLNVAPGTTVTWKNTDTVSHYVTSGLPSDNTTGTVFDSGNLIKPGGTFQFTFANAGTYNYYCTVHPWMTGQVIVGGSTNTPSPQPIPTPTPQPTPPTIPSGVDIVIAQGAGASASADCISNNNCFSPNSLYINSGRTITWFNGDLLSHTVTSGHVSDSNVGSLFDSGLIRSGGEFQFTFRIPGTYNYFCTVHPWMTGQVVVAGTAPTPTPTSPSPVITTSVDKSSYVIGDTIVVSGIVQPIVQGTPLQIRILDPSNNLVQAAMINVPSGDGKYADTIRIAGDLWKTSGTYTVVAQYGSPNVVAQSTFTLLSSSTQTLPQSPPTIPSGVDITISQGAGASASAYCVGANNCFTPNPLNVAPGTTVTWKNTDTVSHYVTSGLPSDNTTGTVFDSGNLIKPGGTFQFTFANAGTYNYFCTVHPWMTGQVVVAGTTPTVTNILLQVSTDKNSYSPGDFVTVNADASGSSPGQNIAVNVIDATGSTVVSRTVTTNDQNNANLQFKLSSSASTGTYQVIVTASSNGNNYKQSTQFTVQQPVAQISIISIQATDQQGNPVTSFNRGANGFVKVVLSSQSSHSALTTVNLFGSDSTSIGLGSFKTTLSQGQSEMILSFYIPNNAATGTANIYADVDSDWPTKGGTPLTSESASTVEVQ